MTTTKSVIDTDWREERLGIVWITKHSDSEEEIVGVKMGWDG